MSNFFKDHRPSPPVRQSENENDQFSVDNIHKSRSREGRFDRFVCERQESEDDDMESVSVAAGSGFNDRESVQDRPVKDNDSISHVSLGGGSSINIGQVFQGAPGNLDPIKWDELIQNVCCELNIPTQDREGDTPKGTSYLPSHLSGGSEKQKVTKLPLEGKISDIVQDIDRQGTKYGKVSAFRNRDEKAFLITDTDFEKFGKTTRLDSYIEEGLVGSSSHQGQMCLKSKLLREVNKDLTRNDSGARVLLRAISYATMIVSYMDKSSGNVAVQQAGRQALASVFMSMADVTSCIMVNSALGRRKLFLNEVNFVNKATESRLLSLPTMYHKRRVICWEVFRCVELGRREHTRR
ncbi:uncharacterized protein [Argopecten irradians]|uniref:uncharacterized protein n=1 Tax=Argopecten irradians TaxID=31199 RepID=UPI0037163C4F